MNPPCVSSSPSRTNGMMMHMGSFINNVVMSRGGAAKCMSTSIHKPFMIKLSTEERKGGKYPKKQSTWFMNDPNSQSYNPHAHSTVVYTWSYEPLHKSRKITRKCFRFAMKNSFMIWGQFWDNVLQMNRKQNITCFRLLCTGKLG